MRLRKRESAADAVAEAQRAWREENRDAHLACVERSVARFPEDAAVRLEYAAALLGRDPERAASEALRAVALDTVPDAARLTRAAGLLLSVDETAAARSCVEQAASTHSTNVVIVNQLAALRGRIAAREQDYESAEHFLAIAHEADPADEFFARDLAAVIIARTDRGVRLHDALAVLDRTLGLASDQSQVRLEGREILEQQRAQIQSVLSELSQGQLPRDTARKRVRPHVGPRPGGRQTASEMRPAATITPTNARNRSVADAVVRAQKLLASGKAKQYLSFTGRAVSRFPNDAAIRLEHATALAPYSPENAISHARRVGQLEAEDELTRTALMLRAGRLAIDLGAISDANAFATRAAEHANAHVMLANALAALKGRIAAASGDRALAEAELRRAHSADPIHSVYALDLAEFLLIEGRSDDALEVIERTLGTPQREGHFEAQAGRELERLRTQIRDRNDAR